MVERLRHLSHLSTITENQNSPYSTNPGSRKVDLTLDIQYITFFFQFQASHRYVMSIDIYCNFSPGEALVRVIQRPRPSSTRYVYSVAHLVADHGWVDLDLECSTVCLILLGLMESGRNGWASVQDCGMLK